MATWSEVRELAAKLKSTQESPTLLRLSERTWVDIIRQLINDKRLKLIFTSDGRAYLTKNELEKEIREEVEAHGGRVSLSEIALLLDVDQSTVESQVAEMISSDALSKMPNRLIGIPGEILNEFYLRQVAHDIRDRLEERGQTTIGELSTVFSLPTSVVLNIIQQYQGVLFRLHKYGDEYITDAYLSLRKAKVRGYFMPFLRPVAISFAATRLQMPESLLSSIITTLINDGRLHGFLANSRTTYIPSCYTVAENSYILEFYNRNGYVEWDHMKRLGISGPSPQQRALLSNAIHLSSVSVGPAIVNQLTATVEEAAQGDFWVDLSHCFPPGVSPKDRLILLSPVLETFPLKPLDHGLYLVSDGFLIKCLSYFDELLLRRSELALKDRPVLSQVSEQKLEHEVHAKHFSQNPKGGFGIGAREVKVKNVKKKYAVGKKKRQTNADGIESPETGHSTDHGNNSLESVFMKYVPLKELIEILVTRLSEDVPRAVIEGVVEIIWPQLVRNFSKLLTSIFLPTSDSAHIRESASQTQEAVDNMLLSIQLIERGITAIDRYELQKSLINHLVKNHGMCLVDRLCVHLAQYYGLRWPEAPLSCDSDSEVRLQRLDFVTPATNDQRNHLVKLLLNLGSAEAVDVGRGLNSVLEKLRGFQLSALSMTDYYSCVETLAAEHMGLILNHNQARADNKRKKEERNKANELALQMEMQLDQAFLQFQDSADMKDAAIATLAAACLFSQVVTGWPIVAPGKLVPQLVDWLSEAKLRKPTGSGIHAFEKFVSSRASDNLVLLTAKITSGMQTDNAPNADSEIHGALKELVETAKICRKSMYA